MKALLNRVERVAGQYARDQDYTAQLQSLAAPMQEEMAARDGLLQLCPAALQYRWMLEEYRVSLFAQHLGTRQAVSEKRLRQQWREVVQWLEANPR